MALSADNNAASATNVFREAVCIDTKRIYDACSDRDCIRGLQVAFTSVGQPIIDAAATIKARCAEVIGVFFEVEPVPFNRGFYSVDMTYFFKVHISAYNSAAGIPTPVEGLATFNKKVILFGSEASVKTFSTADATPSGCSGIPTVNVQTIDPMILACDVCNCTEVNTQNLSIPDSIASQFAGSFEGVSFQRSVTLTIGLFSIVQLERRVQVMIPIYDFCIPDKACTPKTSDPCELFGQIAFPVDEFFPPKLCDLEEE